MEMEIITIHNVKEEQWKGLKRKAFEFGRKFDIGVSIDMPFGKVSTIEIRVWPNNKEELWEMKKSFAKWEARHTR